MPSVARTGVLIAFLTAGIALAAAAAAAGGGAARPADRDNDSDPPALITGEPAVRRQVRVAIKQIEGARGRAAYHPPFLHRLADDLQDLLRRYLLAPDQIDYREIRAAEDVLVGAAEWRRRETGVDQLHVERDTLLELLRRLRERRFSTQQAHSSAPQGASLVFLGATLDGTVPAMADETPKERRRRIIGANITRFREAAELSKNELARRLETDRGSIVRWEAGRWEPNPDHLEELARVFSVPVHEFYREPAAAA